MRENMSKRFKIIVLCITVCIGVCLTALILSGRNKYCFNKNMLELSGTDSESFVAQINYLNTDNEICENIKVDSRGNVVVKLTEEQQKKWMRGIDTYMQQLIFALDEIGVSVECNQDYTTIDIKCKKEDMGVIISDTYIQNVMIYSLFYQAIDGVNYKKQQVELVISDEATDEVIFEDRMDYKTNADDRVNRYYIPSYVVDMKDMTDVAIVADLDIIQYYKSMYQDAYYDENENFVFECTPSQSKSFLEGCILSLDLKKFEINEIGVAYNESYTVVTITCKEEQYGVEFTDEDLYNLMIMASNCQTFLGAAPAHNDVYGIIKSGDEVLFETTLSTVQWNEQ